MVSRVSSDAKRTHQSRFGLVNFLSHVGPVSFMPIMRVHDNCVSYEAEVNNKKVLFVNPTRNKVFL